MRRLMGLIVLICGLVGYPYLAFSESISADIVFTPSEFSAFFGGYTGGDGDATTNTYIDWSIGNTAPFASVTNDMVFSTSTGDFLNAGNWKERMRITKEGNVGIGTAVPTAQLHVYKPDTVSEALLRVSSGTFPEETRLVVMGDGHVGIGTSSPVGKLHVAAGAGEGLRVTSSNGNSHFPYSNGWSYISGKGIIFRTNGNTERMRLLSNGILIIGGTGELTHIQDYHLQVSSGGYFVRGVNALFFTDRTPYPKDLETAYAAVLSMERLPPEEYDENNKENQLDHSKLHGFVKSQDGMYRNLSATVSAQNEVIKDLLKRIEKLEAKLK